MAITSGFFNSLNHDRTYNAGQFSDLISSLVIDGVFQSVGASYVVKENSGATVNVGIGRSWFNGVWMFNDSILPIKMGLSNVLLDRIDSIVIEVNKTDAVREATIKIVEGEASSSPKRPTLIKENGVYQYPLCYIYRKANTETITQSDITNCVGTSECPFITGILKTVNIDELITQWKSQFGDWMNNNSADFTSWMNAEKQELEIWSEEFKAILEQDRAAFDIWLGENKTDFLTWFNQMKDQLSEDAAGNLQNQINEIHDNLVAENLIVYPYYESTCTNNGITFTDNGDGTITIGAGTATANTYFFLISNIYADAMILDKGVYTASGVPDGYSTICIGVTRNVNGTRHSVGKAYGGSITFNAINDGNTRYDIHIGVTSGTVISEPITIKPMLEKGKVKHPWQPYSLSRTAILDAIPTKQLTELEERVDKQLGNLTFRKISQADYDALTTPDDNTVYIIT